MGASHQQCSDPDGPVPLTAYVVMRPADGSSSLSALVTAETIGRLQPAEWALERARAFFAARGFKVGPFVGISFAITAEHETFRRTFGSVEPEEVASGMLTLDLLGPDLTSIVEAVIFDESAELFGTADNIADGGSGFLGGQPLGQEGTRSRDQEVNDDRSEGGEGRR